MRSLSVAAVSAMFVLTLVGCSTAGPAGTASQPPGVPTLPPGVPTLPPGVPTFPPVDGASVCAGQPTYSADASATPVFAQDATLNAAFPTTINGQPVTDIQSGFWLQSMCYYGASAQEVASFLAIFPAALAPQISSGSADVELDGETVDIQAFRVPGSDANLIFSHIPEFIAALGGDPASAANDVVTQSNIGGKNAYVITDEDGDVTYNYVSGDTVWSVDASESAAAAVFAALP
ncbi:MAG TPA: hypothetical protein VM284_03740 [Candidatus Limnocylindria bacterium]|nr:hypothetical protein [Candidatus Limnocylindria bacterium]